jgi:hypothetical protein
MTGVVLLPEAAGRPYPCRRAPRVTPMFSRRHGVGVAGEVAASRQVLEARRNNKSGANRVNLLQLTGSLCPPVSNPRPISYR